jgi:hypothetical protein
MANALLEAHIRAMTVNERIEQSSFAYDAQFPPDVAEGLPLSAAARRRRANARPFRRALRNCARAASTVGRRA